jgi:hypothetical protein
MHRTVSVFKLLIIDEIGYLPPAREQVNLFFQVVAGRGGSLIARCERLWARAIDAILSPAL